MSAKTFYYEKIKKSPESDDRSSASSIPWNSDAIQQNKILWERIERYLNEEEEPPDDLCPELYQEILDWQLKFPQLSKAKSKTKSDWKIKQSTFNTSSTNVSEFHDLSSSPDNSIEEDEKSYLTELESTKTKNPTINTKSIKHHYFSRDDELAEVFGKDLHITPLTLRQRKSARLLGQRDFSITSAIDDSPIAAKANRRRNHAQIELSGNVTSAKDSRFHMPPLVNVLDPKRRFCAISGNRSFVQLSAAAVHSATRLPPTEKIRVWNKPFDGVTVNSRFFNNRNAIILPALQHRFVPTTTNSSNQRGQSNSRQFNNFSTSNSSLSSGDIRGRQRTHYLSNSRTTTTSSGRSISAVPMHLHGAFYNL